MSVVDEWRVATTQRLLKPYATHLRDMGSDSSAAYVESLTEPRDARIAWQMVADASGVEPPNGALHWHGYLEEFENLGNDRAGDSHERM